MNKTNQFILIQNISPLVDGGRYPAKALVGEPLRVEADILRDGFKELKAALNWKTKGAKSFFKVPMSHVDNDRWAATFTPTENTRHVFFIESWTEGSEPAKSAEYELIIDRRRAAVGAWYEFFPRSSGTFRQAEEELNRIKAMGFDTVYLAPFHPIGKTARKGKDGALTATADDPGSPWAIGSADGGHTAIDPALGTLADFQHFLKTAEALKLDVAMDFAIQCSPDHPWIKEHPSWFYWRPDGTLQCAENPPMKYEDIVPLNFETKDWETLWDAWRKVMLFWVEQGVKIFRVDNPHTKPVPFWEWLISSIQEKHPDVLFLAEAFTRPKMMKSLSKAGFSQSYTYFIWRTTKDELQEYMEELSDPDMTAYFRPNFFVNTHDVLHEFLVQGGCPAFKIRLALAATLSPSYGMYAGYEICENELLPGTTDYVRSEKFERKQRDWNKAGNISSLITALNKIRQENAALQKLDNVVFFPMKNERIIAYGKTTPDHSNTILAVVSLDAHQPQEGSLQILQDKMGMSWGSRFEVRDLLSGETQIWSEHNPVKLDPSQPVRIYRVERRNV